MFRRVTVRFWDKSDGAARKRDVKEAWKEGSIETIRFSKSCQKIDKRDGCYFIGEGEGEGADFRGWVLLEGKLEENQR